MKIQREEKYEAPLLDWTMFCFELQTLWNATKDTIPELQQTSKEERASAASEIFYQLLIDYTAHRENPDSDKILKYKLAEA